jgi:hypothetical protein
MQEGCMMLGTRTIRSVKMSATLERIELATREGGEWELIEILLNGDDFSNKMKSANQSTSPTELPKLAKTT